MSLYHVTAERSGKWWVLQAKEAPGAISQVSRLDQADEIREAIAFVTGERGADITIEVEPVLPAEVARHLRESRRQREISQEANARAADEARAAARALADENLTIREIGRVLGVSHQRAAQLVKASPRSSSRVA